MGSQGPSGTIPLQGFTLGAINFGNAAASATKFSLNSNGSLSRADHSDFKFAAQLESHGGLWVAHSGNVGRDNVQNPSEYVACTRDDTGPFSTLSAFDLQVQGRKCSSAETAFTWVRLCLAAANLLHL
jgi:hypothetical protein